MKSIIVNGMELKPYNEKYYVSNKGDVYSKYTNQFLKHEIDRKGYHRVNVYENKKHRHVRVHLMVYTTWVGDIPNDLMVCHKDDNKDNNYVCNLKLGTMHDNAMDCVRNRHHNTAKTLVVYDKYTRETVEFYPARNLLEYANHPYSQKSHKSGIAMTNIFKAPWFKERFDVIDYYFKKESA